MAVALFTSKVNSTSAPPIIFTVELDAWWIWWAFFNCASTTCCSKITSKSSPSATSNTWPFTTKMKSTWLSDGCCCYNLGKEPNSHSPPKYDDAEIAQSVEGLGAGGGEGDAWWARGGGGRWNSIDPECRCFFQFFAPRLKHATPTPTPPTTNFHHHRQYRKAPSRKSRNGRQTPPNPCTPLARIEIAGKGRGVAIEWRSKRLWHRLFDLRRPKRWVRVEMKEFWAEMNLKMKRKKLRNERQKVSSESKDFKLSKSIERQN